MSKKTNIETLVDEAKITTWSANKVLICIEDVDVQDIVDQIDSDVLAENINLADVLENFEVSEILNSTNVDEILRELVEMGYKVTNNN